MTENPPQPQPLPDADPELFTANFGDWLKERGVVFTGDWNTEHGGFDAVIDLNQLKMSIILLIEAKQKGGDESSGGL